MATRRGQTAETLDRIVRAAGLDIHVELRALPGCPDPAERGRELAEALRLASLVPAD